MQGVACTEATHYAGRIIFKSIILLHANQGIQLRTLVAFLSVASVRVLYRSNHEQIVVESVNIVASAHVTLHFLFEHTSMTVTRALAVVRCKVMVHNIDLILSFQFAKQCNGPSVSVCDSKSVAQYKLKQIVIAWS